MLFKIISFLCLADYIKLIKMFYLYLLRSTKDEKYYIGQTNDVEKRLMRHNSGQVISTKFRRPFKLVGFDTFKTRNEARWAEYTLKNHSDKKKKFIDKLEKRASGLGEPPARRGGEINEY